MSHHSRGQFLVGLVLAAAVFAGSNSLAATGSLVIQNATVIDIVDGTLREDVTVVLEDDRISAIGSQTHVRAPDGAVVVDAAGKYLIPGLWDMHVHWYEDEYLPLFIANGVTGVRVMSGGPLHHQWREKISNGELLGPRLVTPGPIVDGQPPIWPNSMAVTNEADARACIARLKSENADFIKVYARIPRDAYFALVEEATRQNLPVAGHVPDAVSAREAATAGQRCIEHLDGILMACSSDEEQVRKRALELDRLGVETGKSLWSSPEGILWAQRVLTTYSEEKAEALFRHFKKHGTWHCPTLTVRRSTAFMNDPVFTKDQRTKYMPVRIRMMWNPAGDFRWKNDDEEPYHFRRLRLEKFLVIVNEMHRAGVGLLAGTDVLNPYCFPGFSLHDELELLVKAGLEPIDALRTATINPAMYLGQDRQFGSIEQGKVADLVLLSANPLENIKNTRSIVGVIARGQHHDVAALQEMLVKIERLASRKSIAAVLATIIADQNVSAAVNQYRELTSTKPDEYDFRESELNVLGYQLLEKGQISDAIVIFQLNVEAFPESANVYDSLGEAFMKGGKKEKAIQNYMKSLEVDPDNRNAVEMLKRLRDGSNEC